MTLASKIDLSNPKSGQKGDVVLGEDWVGMDSSVDSEMRASRERRGFLSLNRSPLARKIITFNLLALILLVAGVMFLNPFRDSLVLQRENGLVAEAELIADVFEAQLSEDAPVDLVSDDLLDPAETLRGIDLASGVEIFVFNPSGVLVATTVGEPRNETPALDNLQVDDSSTLITDFLDMTWRGVSSVLTPADTARPEPNIEGQARALVADTVSIGAQIKTGRQKDGGTIFSVATPIVQGTNVVGVVSITSAAGEIDELVKREREQVLQMFVIAIFVSIGLSLVLASTIANPLSDLAAAAELGRDKDARKMSPGRVRIPDLTARPDEIGRLSGALRGMVAALYDRIDANEQFAADVAHEIKNPLASLRSAVGTLRVAKKEDHRVKLLDVIEHDVRRLDRLVSDISNASRLDSELVKEEEESFNLLKMLKNLTEYLGQEASSKGIEFISDLPSGPIVIQGLEARLAQVFVNLITNAMSFCEEGDAIRVWARRRENRVLVVVEDTGPGIPDQALHKIFNRFYSERPPGQFGNNSGLGLAISKQIVDAHGGVIWAENIRPTDADITSEPLGARFVVGLSI
ncbi:sensor N-terminal transmembrane domain-containing protein [Pseudohalocynthiibacter aestuariivivens]|jgi:two-component system, OmpR family, sensor histidine kinase ChvG|uniref:histidine kinase n=1 Tax=Pseudohalocynthiibacter aestuariivivens TaxID=1591409 RepID=A0ABV5JJC3_9RHOB|nr:MULTISPECIES: sensor histidine kinase [Pseudohalocynthiibacter]MBS9715480.1 sensor histidine kinase [Pseudohalocynthiibacter aestuariivivens]MCK0102574.1 sensor histidine kinase [Pseudohalocynthiibacter sp. F2068]